jgi:hypothetical protein
MPSLIEKLQARVADWRSHDFRDDVYPAIAEILHWAAAPEGAGFTLRAPQLRALEVYWFLRLVEGTPKVIDLYQKDFPSDDPGSLLEALGIPDSAWKESKYALSQLWNNIESNDDFIRRHSLQAVRETLPWNIPATSLRSRWVPARQPSSALLSPQSSQWRLSMLMVRSSKTPLSLLRAQRSWARSANSPQSLTNAFCPRVFPANSPRR